MKLGISKREAFYLSIFLALFLLILVTPFLANEHVLTSLDDNFAEAIVLFLLLGIFLLIFRFYRKELEKSYRNTNELVNYIANINVQIQQMKSVFSDISKYPQNKNDLKYVFRIMAERILGAVNVDWVLFRILESDSAKTLYEFAQARGKALLVKYEISNRDLLGDRLDENYAVIKTSQENFNIRTCCVLSSNNLNKDQKMLVRKIVNDLEMLYLIYSSAYYKNTNGASARKDFESGEKYVPGVIS